MPKKKPRRLRKNLKKLFSSKNLNILASIMVIATALITAYVAWQVKTVVVETMPNLRVKFWPALHGPSAGVVGIEKDRCTLSYFEEEDLEYLDFDIDVINIGSGVAYDLKVEVYLPGLKYSQIAEDQRGVKQYEEERKTEELFHWTDNFYYTNIILSPEGGKLTLGLNIPYGAIGSIENLPTAYTITIKDMDKKNIVGKNLGFRI